MEGTQKHEITKKYIENVVVLSVVVVEILDPMSPDMEIIALYYSISRIKERKNR